MKTLLRSRKFWTILLDTLGIIGGFVLTNYLPQYKDAIVVIVAACQPLVLFLIAQFTVDDTIAKVAKAMGKTLLVLMFLAIAFTPFTTFADSPAYHYGMVKCSGLSLAELGIANQKFDSAYGWAKQLTTPQMWQGTYIARVNQFASSVGCPQVLIDDNTPTGQLTLHYKIYDVWYQFYLNADIAPQVFGSRGF